MKGRSIINILVLILLLVAPAVAQARTILVLPDGTIPQPEQAWIDRAEVPTPDEVFVLYREECPTQSPRHAACVQPLTGELWLDPIYRSRERSLLHEIGHIFAWRHRFLAVGDAPRNKKLKKRFLEIADLEGKHKDPPEAFANAYSYCAVYGNWLPPGLDKNVFRFYGYIPHQPQHRRVCKFIRSVAQNQ